MDFWITDKSISYNKVKYIMRVFPVFLFPIAFPVCSSAQYQANTTRRWQ